MSPPPFFGLFAAGDVGGLADCLRRLIEDSSLRERLSQAGVSRIRETFSREGSLAQVQATYTRLLEPGCH